VVFVSGGNEVGFVRERIAMCLEVVRANKPYTHTQDKDHPTTHYAPRVIDTD
jgi:hypothetical protein